VVFFVSGLASFISVVVVFLLFGLACLIPIVLILLLVLVASVVVLSSFAVRRSRPLILWPFFCKLAWLGILELFDFCISLAIRGVSLARRRRSTSRSGCCIARICAIVTRMTDIARPCLSMVGMWFSLAGTSPVIITLVLVRIIVFLLAWSVPLSAPVRVAV
jgi:hypothetical protein